MKRKEISCSNASVKRAKSNLFEKMRLLIVQTGIGKARRDIFRNNVLDYGGEVIDVISSDNLCKVTHIIVDESITFLKLLKILKVESIPVNIRIVSVMWLIDCTKSNGKLSECIYEINRSLTFETEEDPSDIQSCSYGITKTESSCKQINYPVTINDLASSSEDEEAQNNVEFNKIPKGSWACKFSSNNIMNCNKHITDKLEEMKGIYENVNDKWRVLGYQKAISALKKYTKKIHTYEEACSIPGIGKKLGEKVWEIIESGDLQKVNELSTEKDIAVMKLFTNVWGAGVVTAKSWIAQGFNTLEDLEKCDSLTKNQRIGLKYYHEFIDRMAFSEAAEIEHYVRDVALQINSKLTVTACGSYRRKKTSCGDVDILITHTDGVSHSNVFLPLLCELRKTGFLTDDLVYNENNGNQRKYMGVCQLPNDNSKHRRLDIICVPYKEYACAVLYFTGSAHFNRSMRNLANKMGMSLSEHSLNKGVVKKSGVKINKGVPLPTPSEKSIFDHLGLEYREPEERDHS